MLTSPGFVFKEASLSLSTFTVLTDLWQNSLSLPLLGVLSLIFLHSEDILFHIISQPYSSMDLFCGECRERSASAFVQSDLALQSSLLYY